MADSDSTLPRKRWRAGRVVPVLRHPYQPLPAQPLKLKKVKPLAFDQLMGVFQKRARAGEPPMALLREYAEIRVPNKHPYKARRHGRMRLPKVREETCFACERFRPVSRHHVIQVQHGGPNHKHNLVYLCAYCHAEIHPWLHKTPDLPEEQYQPAWAAKTQ